MVTPQRKLPLSGSSSPTRIWKRVVRARELPPTKAILSPLRTIRSKLFNTLTPSISLVSPLIARMISPQALSGLKTTYGYFLDEVGMSSMVSLSSSFLRDVACLDLDALALKRWIKALSSSAFSDILRLSFCFCFKFNWLARYQKSVSYTHL